jgi:hypothetical protein
VFLISAPRQRRRLTEHLAPRPCRRAVHVDQSVRSDQSREQLLAKVDQGGCPSHLQEVPHA